MTASPLNTKVGSDTVEDLRDLEYTLNAKVTCLLPCLAIFSR
jgi:hypothetical protein